MDIITRYFDVPYRNDRAVDFLIPDKVTRSVGVFAIHGGGWSQGRRSGYHRVLHALANEGYACASTDYRLHMNADALKHKLQDVRIGYDLFRRHLAERGLGRKVRRFAALGSSAGAHLAGLMAAAAPGVVGEATDRLTLRYKQPVGMILVCAPVTLKPWKGIEPDLHQRMEAIIGCPYEQAVAAWKAASIDTHITAGGPDVLLIDARHDHLLPNALTKRHVKRWRQRGVRVEHQIFSNVEHGFFYEIGPEPQRAAALAATLAFLKSLAS